MSFCPENIGNWSSSPQNESEFFPRSIQSCFALLQEPSYRKPPWALFRSNWVKYDYKPRSDKKKRCFRSDQGLKSYLTIQLDRKSAGGDVLQLGTWRSGKQLWIHLGENSDSFWGEKDQFPTFSGQKLMQTYWTVLFQRTAKNLSAQELAWY